MAPSTVGSSNLKSSAARCGNRKENVKTPGRVMLTGNSPNEQHKKSQNNDAQGGRNDFHSCHGSSFSRIIRARILRSNLQPISKNISVTITPVPAKTRREVVGCPNKRLIEPPTTATRVNHVRRKSSVEYLMDSVKCSLSAIRKLPRQQLQLILRTFADLCPPMLLGEKR